MAENQRAYDDPQQDYNNLLRVCRIGKAQAAIEAAANEAEEANTEEKAE